ncbi:DUF6303 family protein [[Kitasatospora] papulosa]
MSKLEAWIGDGLKGWALHVLLLDRSPLAWPERVFDLTWPPRIPTKRERAAVLATLGYVAEDGAEWSWREIGPHLVASIPVRPATANGAGGGRA